MFSYHVYQEFQLRNFLTLHSVDVQDSLEKPTQLIGGLVVGKSHYSSPPNFFFFFYQNKNSLERMLNPRKEMMNSVCLEQII